MAGLKEWALRGAEARVAEIQVELAKIRRTFPGLGAGGRGRRVAIGIAPVKRRKRKPMSAAQKRAVGIRMKAYWAARRKARS